MKSKTAKKSEKAYWEMNAEELGEATKEFDRPIPASRMKPLSKAEREKFDRERHGPAVNIFSKSAKRRQVTLKLDMLTLQRCEAYAAKHRLTLSDVVNMGLASVFQFAE
jgi:hypothetical protein